MRQKSKSVILFDEASRRDFVVGSHKRNVEKRKKNKEKFEEQLREARKKIKRKARETLHKLVNSCNLSQPMPVAFEKHYELPHHSVKVQELSMDEIANVNNWIGENKMKLTVNESTDIVSKKQKKSDDLDELPGMSLTSIKEIKKIINEQSKSLVQCDKIFRRKNRIEKIINKRRAERKRKMLEKERKKLKGRKRK